MIVELCDYYLDVSEIALINPEINKTYVVMFKSGFELLVSTEPGKRPYHDRAKLIEKWKFSQASQR